MRRRLTTLLVVGTMMAAMVVDGAGSAYGQSFDIVERGSGNGGTVLQSQFEDLPDEFTLGEFGLDVCGLQDDTLVASENSGFFRRIATPSGEETRQVFISREVSFTQDRVQYTGTLHQLLVPLYSPDGRLVSERWRWVSGFAVVFCVGATGLAMVRPGDDEAPGVPNPLGVESLVEGAGSLTAMFGILLPAGWLVFGTVAATSLIVRFGRSRGEERPQIKWFVYAVVLCILVLTAGQAFLNDLLPTGGAKSYSSSPSRACG